MNRDHIDLCSGIGGFALGFSWSDLDTTPKLFCDTDPWCRKVLAKNFPNVPIANDVKEIANDPRKIYSKKAVHPHGWISMPTLLSRREKR